MDSETQALVRPTEVTQVEGNLLRGGSSAYANISADGFLLEYVTVLKKHRWRVFTVAVVVVTLSTISALKAVPLYVATGRIAINRETPVNLGFHDMDPDVDDFDTNIALETQVKILQSKVLAAEVIKNAGLVISADSASGLPTVVPTNSTLELNSAQEKAQVNRYLSSLGVKVLPGTRVLEIQYTDPNPRHAAEMVNETISTYIDQNYQTKVNATNQTAVWLQKELTDLRLKMETAEAELIKYQKENNIFGVDDKQNIISSTLDDLNKRLTEAETERIQKESMYQMAADGHADLFEQQEIGGTMLDRLRERQSDLRTQYTVIRTSLGPHYPKAVEIQNQLEQTQAEIDAENGRLALKLKRDYMAAINREKLLSAALDEQKAKSNAMSQSAIQFNILKRDADSYRTVYEGLLQKMKEAGISVGLKSNNVRILDAADVPS
ncbi:MAG: GumC family protein, partial [Terriglobales bacterium]